MSAADWLNNTQATATAKYGIPASDPGAAIARDKSPVHVVDTSGIFQGNSLDQAVRYRVRRGPDQKPISAKAGKGDFFEDTSSVAQTPQQ